MTGADGTSERNRAGGPRDDLQAAVDAVRHAMERLVAASPNGRDYYVQDAGAIGRVQFQHERRFESLRSVQAELIEMLEHVVAVMDYREVRRSHRP